MRCSAVFGVDFVEGANWGLKFKSDVVCCIPLGAVAKRAAWQKERWLGWEGRIVKGDSGACQQLGLHWKVSVCLAAEEARGTGDGVMVMQESGTPCEGI